MRGDTQLQSHKHLQQRLAGPCHHNSPVPYCTLSLLLGDLCQSCALSPPQVPDWFLNRQRDFRDGKTSQIVSSTVDSKLREDFERLKKIRSAAA